MEQNSKQNLTETDKQLKRIADSLEKIAKALEPQSLGTTTQRNLNVHSMLRAIASAIPKDTK